MFLCLCVCGIGVSKLKPSLICIYMCIYAVLLLPYHFLYRVFNIYFFTIYMVPLIVFLLLFFLFLGVLMALTFLKCMVVVAAVIITEEFMQYMYICVCFLKLRFRCVCVFLMYYIENLVLLLFSWSLLTKATSMLLLLLSAASISLCFSIIGNNQSLMSTHFARFLATSSLLINITFCKERKITIENFK